ncbi:MAG: hypothetical protein JO332_11785, partial [Planctomycetaceae bacterium]|nr:hypothetical protein [Planctomycetaceae bacterium]
ALLLQAADWICDEHRLGNSGNDYPAKPPAETFRTLRLTDESIASVVEKVREEPLLSLLLPV